MIFAARHFRLLRFSNSFHQSLFALTEWEKSKVQKMSQYFAIEIINICSIRLVFVISMWHIHLESRNSYLHELKHFDPRIKIKIGVWLFRWIFSFRCLFLTEINDFLSHERLLIFQSWNRKVEIDKKLIASKLPINFN